MTEELSTMWTILGITPTTDARTIRRAYASVLKKNRPDDDPVAFQVLRDALAEALFYAQQNEEDEQQTHQDQHQPDGQVEQHSKTLTRSLEVISPIAQTAPYMDYQVHLREQLNQLIEREQTVKQREQQWLSLCQDTRLSLTGYYPLFEKTVQELVIQTEHWGFAELVRPFFAWDLDELAISHVALFQLYERIDSYNKAQYFLAGIIEQRADVFEEIRAYVHSDMLQTLDARELFASQMLWLLADEWQPNEDDFEKIIHAMGWYNTVSARALHPNAWDHLQQQLVHTAQEAAAQPRIEDFKHDAQRFFPDSQYLETATSWAVWSKRPWMHYLYSLNGAFLHTVNMGLDQCQRHDPFIFQAMPEERVLFWRNRKWHLGSGNIAFRITVCLLMFLGMSLSIILTEVSGLSLAIMCFIHFLILMTVVYFFWIAPNLTGSFARAYIDQPIPLIMLRWQRFSVTIQMTFIGALALQLAVVMGLSIPSEWLGWVMSAIWIGTFSFFWILFKFHPASLKWCLHKFSQAHRD